MKPINASQYRSVNGYDRRIRFLILHYTAGNFSASVNALTGPTVSAHYLIPDITDPSYLKAGFSEQEVFRLVDEEHRAWHAGNSAWGNRSQLNDTSIGIEIVNLAREDQGQFSFPPYHPEQMVALEHLALDILKRYPEISPVNVLGHSDIAIGRKTDPGPKFPWHALYLKGIGAWFDQPTLDRYWQAYRDKGLPSREQLLTLFKAYGYNTAAATTEPGFQQLVRAFQLHFRPEKNDGIMDQETAASLAALVQKYVQ